MATVIRKRTLAEENIYKDWVKNSKGIGLPPKLSNPTGSWLAVIRITGQPQIKKSFKRKAEAEAWVIETERKILNGGDLAVSKNTTKFEDAIEKYLSEISANKGAANNASVDFETSVLKPLLKKPCAKKRLSKITKSDIASIMKDWRSASNVPNTINRKLAVISDLFRVAEKEWGFERMENPCAGKRIKLKPKEGERSRKFEDGEYDRLMTALDSCLNKYIKPIVLFTIETGLRRREVLELARCYVNIEDKYIYITPETAKTRVERYVPLSPVAIKILEETDKISGGDTELIFPITTSAFENAWKKTVVRSGLNLTRSPKGNGFQFRDLRHVALTKLSRIYPRMQDLAKISGHEKLETLLIYYEEDIHDQVNQMDNYYNIS